MLSGSAEVVKKDPGGKHQVLAVLSAPAVLGEMTVLEAGARRSAPALALSPLEAASVPGAELVRLIPFPSPGPGLRRSRAE